MENELDGIAQLERNINEMAEEALNETIEEIAKEELQKKKVSSDPGSHFWYCLLGALVNRGEHIDGVPTTKISIMDIKAIENHIVNVEDSPGEPGTFIVTVRKNA